MKYIEEFCRQAGATTLIKAMGGLWLRMDYSSVRVMSSCCQARVQRDYFPDKPPQHVWCSRCRSSVTVGISSNSQCYRGYEEYAWDSLTARTVEEWLTPLVGVLPAVLMASPLLEELHAANPWPRL